MISQVRPFPLLNRLTFHLFTFPLHRLYLTYVVTSAIRHSFLNSWSYLFNGSKNTHVITSELLKKIDKSQLCRKLLKMSTLTGESELSRKFQDFVADFESLYEGWFSSLKVSPQKPPDALANTPMTLGFPFGLPTPPRFPIHYRKTPES